MIPNQNRKFVLAHRPQGEPKESDFELVEEPIPALGEGEVMVRAEYLSVDPYMKGRMVDAPSYTPPVQLGEVMVGGGAGEVVQSNDPGFAPGEFVEGPLGWQEMAAVPGAALRKLDPDLAPISTACGVLGMPGLTAYFGLLEVGQPKAGETVVVSAASGAVGAVVGQIAKIKGCRAVGIVGSDAKADYITGELGFDAAVNYKTAGDLDAAIGEACPGGVDVYFDNVGGPVTYAVFAHINMGARIAICGQIALYNLEEPYVGDRNLRFMLVNRARMEGLLVFDWIDRYPEGLTALGQWIKEGKLKYKEDVMEGLENMPRALLRLFHGENFGKQLVKVAGAGA
jgi:NADPH-dependent curcumin reductase CurA